MSRLLALSLGHGYRLQSVTRFSLLQGTSFRFASTQSPATSDRSKAGSAADKKKAFSATLRLPKTSLPLRQKNAPKAEQQFRDRTTHELYREQFESNPGEVFIFHDGPPYANGNLHMGHAQNKILKDIINRYNVIRGRKVCYIPGWDCHGLPIEHKALAALGKAHTALDPVMVRQEARKFALQAIDVQKAEFKQLGIMADWDAEKGVYRSLDHDYEIRQLKLFQMMVSKGFITHRHRPTYYSPSSRTALAEAELEYADIKSNSVYVAFPVQDADLTPRLQQALRKGQERSPGAKLHLAIWTTTPWSLPGNMGVSVNEEIDYVVVLNEQGQLLVVAKARLEELSKRFGSLEIMDEIEGKDLVGLRYTHLFHPVSVDGPRPAVFAASYVTADSGTGLVHSAPAHGHDDYDAFKAAGISIDELRCPIDDDGCFTTDVVSFSGNAGADALVGKPVFGAGSKEMVQFLKAEGVLLAQEKIEHRYPCDWRTKQPIIIRATPQWFADVESLKPAAKQAIENINFVPDTGKNRLSAMVLSRSEWCISRQRSWGVPIPALFNAQGDPLLTEESLEHIISVLDKHGVDHWWSGPAEDFIPPSAEGEDFTRGFDTLDVWFDSGTSWSLLEEAKLRPSNEPLADVYLEGSDQHRGWFQSSFLTRLAALEGQTPVAPYRNLITHGFTTDEAGAKMSKSLGNGVSPMDVVNGTKSTTAYGSDTLRVWAAGIDYTRDASIGPTSISHAAEILRKLRSALRFILGNIGTAKPLPLSEVELSLVERYVLHELQSLQNMAVEGYDEFIFNKVLQRITSFTSSTLSTFYFDYAKDTLYCDPVDGSRRQAIVATLQHVLDEMLKIIAPIVPHLAEEVYESSRTSLGIPAKSSVFLEHWASETRWNDETAHADMSALLSVRSQVLGLVEQARQAKHVRVPAETSVRLIPSDGTAELLQRNATLLPNILGVSTVTLGDSALNAQWYLNAEATTAHGTVAVTLTPASGHQCPRCWLHTAESEDSLCGRCAQAIN